MRVLSQVKLAVRPPLQGFERNQEL